MNFEDYHTHHRRCGHASGSLRDVVEAALEQNLHAIGLSDHAPMLFLPGDHPQPGTAMAKSEFGAYVREMHDLKSEYAERVVVNVGVEADYVPGSVDDYRALLAGGDFDYVIGSVHFIDGWHLFQEQRPDGVTREDLWDRALVLTREAAETGLFSILGHLDVLKTKGHLPDRVDTPRLHETLDAVADLGVAMELNTSGWRKSANECFPSLAILKLAAKRGIPVVLGSDAHRPEDVAADFPRAAALLREAGYGELASFSRGERATRPL
ncbi:histidinol-phosphatase [Deinococcus yavapaiensis]|uniref:Histidinol-phosphatase n=1 Tax=Deinococcus yavapaiensis KR-236 TaxID=694435 RepID=A0A318SGH2_9DEIO|nr:histidinol-phosphatase [Deinococcus yavapaiensis]PYE49010.1 histidinol-phosphatase (PHP family) [Deinococcus yavapaiensis KR-236]